MGSSSDKDRTAKYWEEWERLSQSVSNLLESREIANNERVLRAMAKRVRVLEAKIGVEPEDSIVKDV